MAFTINRRLSTLVDSSGQLNTGKIPNDYIDGNHIADNSITTAMLHTSFTVSSSNLSSINSDAVSEGSTNLYHTSERVDDRVASLLTAGTGITLTYDDAANTLTIAGAAQYGDSDVESYLSGGTGVTFSSGVISIGQAVGTSDNVQFNNVQVDGTLTSDDITSTNISIAGNATITGNLTVSGTTTTVNSNTVNIGDNILVLNSDETGTPSQDGGIEIERGTSTNKTLVWDETNDKWTVGSETFVAGTFEGALTGNVTGTVSDISNHDTDSLSEGSTNLYYTDARVESYLDGGTSTPTFASGIISGDLTVDTSTLKVDSTNNRVGIGNATPDVSLDIGSLTDAIHVPVGTTAQRPGTPAAGYFRYNSTTSQFEGYTTEWGAIAGSGGSAMETDTFTGDGSTTAFTLSTAASSEDNLIVFIEGVYQNKDDYVVSGTTLTFDVAPVNTRKIVVHHVKDSISGNNMILNQFSGDGSTTAFTLTVSLTSENNSQIYIDGVYQQKDSYTVGGTTLTFDTAPANGTTIEVMIFTQTTVNVPTANSIGISELNVSDGTSGQVLTTNGSGTLSFSTISGYTDSDVETYLNTSAIYTDPTNDRLGIGAASPSYTLTVQKDVDSFVMKVENDGNSPGTSGNSYADASDGLWVDTRWNTATNTPFKVTSNSGTTPMMIIKGDGKVGIGGNSPQEKLHLDDGSSTNRIRIDGPSTSSYYVGYDGNTDAIQIASSSIIKFQSGSGFNERMRIDSSGNVGIGTDSPDAKLEVEGRATGSYTGQQETMRLSSGSTTLANGEGPGLVFHGRVATAGGTTELAQIVGGRDETTDGYTSGMLAFYTRQVYTNPMVEHMRITSSGRVGIGTTDPDVSLDIGSLTDAIHVPVGTTAQRPTGANGYFRYNSESAKFEGYASGQWIKFKTEDDYPVTSGLYFRYTADSFTYNGTSTPPSWSDTSGNNRNISTTSTSNGGGFWGHNQASSYWPTLETNSSNTNGANNEFKCVRFTNAQGLALPDDSNIAANAASGFSFAYVARYSGAGVRKRILQGGGGSNNLIGFWDAQRGVFFDGSWLVGSGTQHSLDGDDWCIIVMRSTFLTSKTKDNNSGNFVENALTHNYPNANYSASSFRYGLNAGTYATAPMGTTSSEQSTFDIAEIAFWNRDLTDAEIDSVQSFLETKYGI